MRGEDLGDCGGALAMLDAQPVVDVEVEWDETLEGAPPPGEGGCSHSALGGEEGDDDAQHLVGEVADAVLARLRLLLFWLDSSPLVVRLFLHVSRRRHRQPRGGERGFDGGAFWACSTWWRG